MGTDCEDLLFINSRLPLRYTFGTYYSIDKYSKVFQREDTSPIIDKLLKVLMLN